MDLSGRERVEMPIPITSSYVPPHGLLHETPPPPPPPISSTEDHHQHLQQKKGVMVKYRECLKNHAASIGGNATDGCGEFMPSGEEGTIEALKCSACGCHRNFHRKEIEGESPAACDYYHHHPRGLLMIPRQAAAPSGHHQHMIMPLGSFQTSESDEMERRQYYNNHNNNSNSGMVVKKRFRTKFTQEQKEKMLAFAERAGWRLQKQEESVVQQFCQEIGIKRRVLKVWMHNNKHNLAKKSTPSPLQLE